MQGGSQLLEKGWKAVPGASFGVFAAVVGMLSLAAVRFAVTRSLRHISVADRAALL